VVLRLETKQALEQGRALYNAGRYFDAHEAWEGAWLHEDGEVRVLLQGLIQVAAGYLKVNEHGRPAGAARLLGSGLSRLATLPECFLGLSLADFREAVARTVAEVERALTEGQPRLEGGTAPELGRRGLPTPA
jgi:predicted metal-dependent hydrolase